MAMSSHAAAKPPISSAAEINYPPFSIIDDHNHAKGFSVELLRAALAAMNREVTFQTGTWSQIRDLLERGEVQALPLVGRTPERESIFDFTVPYMSLHGAIIIRNDTADINDMEDLRGRRVAVMTGDNAEEFLRREDRGITILTTPTFEDALRELSAGAYDAVITQRLVALRLIQETGLTNLRVIDKPIEGFRQDFCFAVKEGDRETLALLNEGLAIVMADGTYRHLHAKWFAALQIPSNRTIIIGGDHNYPPFEFVNAKGLPAGYAVDLTRAIAQEMGLDIEIRLGPWQDIINSLEAGELDLVQGMFYTPGRDLKFDFTQPHSITHYVGVTRKGQHDPPATIDDLQGKRIVMQRGDAIHDLLVEKGLGDLVSLVDSQEDVLRELVEGKHDCAIAVRISSLHLIEKNGWSGLVLSRRPFASMEYCYAALPGHKALLAQFSEGLKVLDESGEYRRIHEKWLGIFQEEPLPLHLALREYAKVIIPLLLIILAAFLWSWTLRRQVAEKTRELSKSERFQRAMIACSPVALYSIDLEGRVMAWNESARRIFGWQEEEVLGKPLPIVPADKQQEYSALRKRLLENGSFSREEVIRQRKDGSLFHASLSAAAIHDDRDRVIGIMASAEDITGRKQAEEKVTYFSRILEETLNEIYLFSADNLLIRQVNRAAVHNLGYSPDELQTMTPLDFNPEFTPETFAQLIEPLRAGTKEKIVFETFHQRKDKSPYDVEAHLQILHFGHETLFAAIILDITQRRLAEKALRESESRFRQLAETAPIGIVISDRSGKNLFVSKKFVDLFGYTLEDIPSVAKWWPLAYPDKDLRNQIIVDWKAAVNNGLEKGSAVGPEEYPVQCKNGSVRHVEIRMSMSGNLYFIIFTDITERRKLEEQLRQAQKMESVGRLAGGVAHDFNNMLGVILGHAELAMEMINPSDPLQEELRLIQYAARRSTDLTHQLLAFARKQTVAPKVLDLNASVENLLKMLARLIGEDIDLAWRPDPNLWAVKLDPTQLDQILANLCVNARDAISSVGRITIETAKTNFDQAYCAEHQGFIPGDYVQLAVSDDGCGMNRDTLDKIFEPFFTTKELGRGTGLGLATVYGIVKQNNGFINVYSEPGLGTTFRIYLPRFMGEAEAIRPEEAKEPVRGGQETVLLVEDEPALLELGTRIVEKLGYKVLATTAPAEAIRLAGENPGKIHLLITDVVMPGMNGRDLADKLLALHPDIKCLFMSGYTSNVIAHHGVLDDNVNFIQKPFSKQDLAAKIRTALNKSKPDT